MISQRSKRHIPMEAAHLAEGIEAVGVALLNLHVLAPGIASVPVEDERDVLGNGACGEHGDESVLGLGRRLVPEPAERCRDELE